jgi:hypothetical protein
LKNETDVVWPGILAEARTGGEIGTTARIGEFDFCVAHEFFAGPACEFRAAIDAGSQFIEGRDGGADEQFRLQLGERGVGCAPQRGKFAAGSEQFVFIVFFKEARFGKLDVGALFFDGRGVAGGDAPLGECERFLGEFGGVAG